MYGVFIRDFGDAGRCGFGHAAWWTGLVFAPGVAAYALREWMSAIGVHYFILNDSRI
jgi:hypothetical protein